MRSRNICIDLETVRERSVWRTLRT